MVPAGRFGIESLMKAAASSGPPQEPIIVVMPDGTIACTFCQVSHTAHARQHLAAVHAVTGTQSEGKSDGICRSVKGLLRKIRWSTRTCARQGHSFSADAPHQPISMLQLIGRVRFAGQNTSKLDHICFVNFYEHYVRRILCKTLPCDHVPM